MGKKEKDDNKKRRKAAKYAENATEEQPIKSIADLFGTTSRDPTLEALFKPNVFENLAHS